MHPEILATALGDGCDAAVLLYVGNVFESIPVLPEGSEKPGREDDARALSKGIITILTKPDGMLLISAADDCDCFYFD